MLLHLLTERAAGPASFWSPYLAILGDQAAHPLLWGPQQAAWLKGSPLAARLAQRQQQCRDDAAALVAAGANDLPIAASWAAATGTPLVTPGSVSWAAAVLLSRAFCLDLAEPDGHVEGDLSYWGSWGGHGPDTLALVPWADMLAHSSAAGGRQPGQGGGGLERRRAEGTCAAAAGRWWLQGCEPAPCIRFALVTPPAAKAPQELHGWHSPPPPRPTSCALTPRVPSPTLL